MGYSIIYPTCRLEPLLHWTLDSLATQIPESERGDVQFIIVDKFGDDPARLEWARLQFEDSLKGCTLVHTTVKPNVWSGKHRLTSTDYFAASTYRNTGLLLATNSTVAFLDDLSYVCPGWWSHVQQAANAQEIYLGTYDKGQHMVVRNGELIYQDPGSIDPDTRRQKLNPDNVDPFPCTGSWMYGCSMAAPLEAFLQVNGFDEDCDSMGSEDYITGMLLEKYGWHFRFCPSMKTIESYVHHGLGEVAKRVDKPMGGTDASHVILHSVMNGTRKKSAFYSNQHGNLRDAREEVLATGKLPDCSIPEHDWRDGQRLDEM